MKVLFSGCPGYGHVHPMLPLARAAMRAGHDVFIATGPDLAPHLAARGFHTWAVGPSFAESWVHHNAVLSDLYSIRPNGAWSWTLPRCSATRPRSVPSTSYRAPSDGGRTS